VTPVPDDATVHSVEALEDMAHHVCYEVEQLVLGVVPNGVDLTVSVRNAMLEARLVHLRNLAKFLTDPRPSCDDVHKLTDLVADHYFDDGWHAPRSVLGSSRERQGKVLNAINRRVVHLSTERRDTSDVKPFRWDSSELIDAVPSALAGFAEFVAKLHDAHPERAAWFDRPGALVAWALDHR